MFTATSKKDLKNAETSDLDMNIIPMVEPEKQPKPSSTPAAGFRSSFRLGLNMVVAQKTNDNWG
jgi:hypothetical protein